MCSPFPVSKQNSELKPKIEKMTLTTNEYGWLNFSKSTYPYGAIIISCTTYLSIQAISFRYAYEHDCYLIQVLDYHGEYLINAQIDVNVLYFQ